MKHDHTLAAIEAAERRMEISKRETREGLDRVKRAFHDLAEDGEIERQYKRWFLQRLPAPSGQTGQSLDLPMSPQLETIIRTLAESKPNE